MEYKLGGGCIFSMAAFLSLGTEAHFDLPPKQAAV